MLDWWPCKAVICFVSPILWLIGINRQDFAITYTAKEHFILMWFSVREVASFSCFFFFFFGVHCTFLSYITNIYLYNKIIVY